ncbi:MAG TPA: hypothetical protein PK677_11405 [Acidiphilium sp.]|nr:hypothetical protein [Acidiphilium sp.]
MADQSAVEQAIVNQVSAVCYPKGIMQPSIIGNLIQVTRGWPTESGVAKAVKEQNVLIAVHALKGYSKDTTRYALDWHVSTQLPPTLTADLVEYEITFGGSVTAGNTVGVLSFGVAYTHVATASDTLSTIASALAAQIPLATASGAVLTLPTALPLTTQSGESITVGGALIIVPLRPALPAVCVVNGGTASVEVGRMQQGFAVSIWAPSPGTRDALMMLLWPAMKYTYRLTLPDGTVATLMQGPGSGPDDVPSREQMFRRDLHLFYDYPIIYSQAVQAAAAILQNYTLNGASPPLDYATV